jgi:hypothetical protein
MITEIFEVALIFTTLWGVNLMLDALNAFLDSYEYTRSLVVQFADGVIEEAFGVQIKLKFTDEEFEALKNRFFKDVDQVLLFKHAN